MTDFLDWLWNEAPDWVLSATIALFIVGGFIWLCVALIIESVPMLIAPPAFVAYLVWVEYKRYRRGHK